MCHLAKRIEALNEKKEKKKDYQSLDFRQLLSSLKINKSRFYGNQREFASHRNGSAEMRVSLPIKSSLEINWNECPRIFAAGSMVRFNVMRIVMKSVKSNSVREILIAFITANKNAFILRQ